jgi:hypothetical protein
LERSMGKKGKTTGEKKGQKSVDKKKKKKK